MHTVDNMRVQNVYRTAHMAPSPTLDLCSIAPIWQRKCLEENFEKIFMENIHETFC